MLVNSWYYFIVYPVNWRSNDKIVEKFFPNASSGFIYFTYFFLKI